MILVNRVHKHQKNENKASKSNALFNTLFLAFSFAVIAIASGNIKMSDSALTKATEAGTENEVVYEQEYALNTDMSKAIYQHKI
jgi:hypothetical protein